MTPPRQSRLRRSFRKAWRARAALDNSAWFRAGYVTALKDIERTGLQPMREDTMRESADRALRDWVEDV